jgi:hypothetical protein
VPEWLAARAAELLPVPYFHVVFTLPAAIGAIAYQNKAKVYGLLFTAAAEALTTIATDPKHLGAEIGVTAVLHTWGQNLDHHPHVHCIVPGGGIAPDGTAWVRCRPGFFLPVRVLSRLFRRLFLNGLVTQHAVGKLQFFGDLAGLEAASALRAYLAPLHKTEWVVYAKRPFAGPAQLLAYLARHTHRVAIGNSWLISASADAVRFRWKDYREGSKAKMISLATGEFIRRFLMHTLPDGFHRIRYYGFAANGHRAARLALCRQLLGVATPGTEAPDDKCTADPPPDASLPCPCCGGRMIYSLQCHRQMGVEMRDCSASFDHHVGLAEQRWRQVETECLRGLQVDDQFELCRSLDGKIRRIGALQDPVDVGGSARLEIRRE